MPEFKNQTEIEHAVQLFNKHAYNAGLEFKVYTSEPRCLYVQASFDFGYYVNVDIEFRDVLFTNCRENESWPDAWNSDQMFLLRPYETVQLIDPSQPLNREVPYFGVAFNITGKSGFLTHGSVIFRSLYINWRHPDKNESYRLSV